MTRHHERVKSGRGLVQLASQAILSILFSKPKIMASNWNSPCGRITFWYFYFFSLCSRCDLLYKYVYCKFEQVYSLNGERFSSCKSDVNDQNWSCKDQKIDRTYIIVFFIFEQIQGTRIIGAVFVNGSNQEATSCHAERRWLQQYPDVCNLTRDNGGMSWYCGKPKNKRISCRNWSFSKYVSETPKLPLTKAEEQVFK